MKLIVPDGTVPTDEVLSREPIAIGEVNVPEAFDNWAVNMFPGLYVPVAVKVTLPVAPARQVTLNGDVETVPVVMVLGVPHEVEPLNVKLFMLKVPAEEDAPQP